MSNCAQAKKIAMTAFDCRSRIMCVSVRVLLGSHPVEDVHYSCCQYGKMWPYCFSFIRYHIALWWGLRQEGGGVLDRAKAVEYKLTANARWLAKSTVQSKRTTPHARSNLMCTNLNEDGHCAPG